MINDWPAAASVIPTKMRHGPLFAINHLQICKGQPEISPRREGLATKKLAFLGSFGHSVWWENRSFSPKTLILKIAL